MTLHKSLVTKNRLVRRRNVLTRGERIKKLEETGKLKEDDSVYGLPKVKVRKVRKRVKMKKKKEGEAVEAAETVETAEKTEKAEKPVDKKK